MRITKNVKIKHDDHIEIDLGIHRRRLTETETKIKAKENSVT